MNVKHKMRIARKEKIKNCIQKLIRKVTKKENTKASKDTD